MTSRLSVPIRAQGSVASVLDSITQEDCDRIGARLEAATSIQRGALGPLDGPCAGSHPDIPLNFTKYFAIMEAISGGDLSGKTILDVGCGAGAFMGQATALGMTAHGIDTYAGQGHSLETLKRVLRAYGMSDREVAGAVTVGDITRAGPDLEGRYDFVTSLGMLEHIPDGGARALAVRNLVKAVKPGGTLIVMCAPNRFFPVDLFHFGPRFPLYHVLPRRVRSVYMARIIAPHRRDLNAAQRAPTFLDGVTVREVTRAITKVDTSTDIAQAFPLLTRLAVSRDWLRRRSAQAVVGALSRTLASLRMEPLIVIVARRSGSTQRARSVLN